MTQGDVLAAIALLIGTCISSWALTMAYGLLFPARSAVAKSIVESRPWKAVGRGALIAGTLGLAAFLLLAIVPNPLVKLVGLALFLFIFSLAGLGMAGIALNAGERLQRMAPEMNHYAAFSRGATFVIGGCIVPIFGWLAFAPLVYLAAIGAGWKAAFSRVNEAPPVHRFEPA